MDSSASIAASSEEEEKERRLIDAMFLCDEWKSSKGGLSTFNRELAINLAETTTGSMKIHCYVSRSDDQDRDDAEQHGVNLITAQIVPGSRDPLDWLKVPPPQLPHPHIVIGHGRKLGTPACHIVRATRCKWIQFVHVFCEDLGKFKDVTPMAVTDTIEENEEKHKMEIELCKAADAVVAVGSRLQQKYSRSLPSVEVEIITPGIVKKFCNESIESGEHAGVLSRSLNAFKSYMFMKTFNVFMFGRATFEDLTLKGYDIVANAIGSLGKEFELTFVGSFPGDHRNVEQWFLQKTCIKRKQITIRRYCTEQDELKGMFHQSDLVALPSRTEGFGLVGLEAISCGVPVLVSGESGVAEALRKVECGNTVIVESDEDEDQWARRISEVSRLSPEERQANARELRENYRKVYSWRVECERLKGLIQNVLETANDGESNIKVEVDDLKPEEQNMQTDMLTTESVRCQEVQQPRASAISAASGSVSYPQTEDLHALQEKIFLSIVRNYLQTTPPQSNEEHNRFMEYMKEMRLVITGVSVGSLVITVKCESLMILEELWTDYSSGHLGEVVQNCFVTEKILKELNLAELRLKTTMDIEGYNVCKMFFEKNTLRGALSSEFHPTSSTTKSPQKKEQWEKSEQKTKIMEKAKLEGTSPLIVLPTTGHGKELEEPWERKEELQQLHTEFITQRERLAEELKELCKVLKRLRVKEKLQRLRPELIIQRERVEGSSPPLVSTVEVELEELLKKLQKRRMEENAMYSTIRSGLVKFDVSLPEELQSYVSYLLNESAKLGLRRRVLQCTGALEELREAMDKDKLKTFLTIHIREGAWQVVLLFIDELPRFKLPWNWYREVWGEDEDEDEDEDEEMFSLPLYSSNSGILKAWPKEYDPGLVTLCKAIINRDWEVTRLILSRSWISDEGLKNLSTALTQSELCSLTLYDIGLQSQGLEHLCEALISVDCNLTSLNVSGNWLGDEGMIRLCNTITSVNCTLTSLNVSDNWLGDKGMVHLCNALTSVNCKLTSLNVSRNLLGDEGIVHLCKALTSVSCTLTSLNVSDNRSGDEGMLHLCNALTSVNCKLTSLNVSRDLLRDEGIMHLCKALTSVNCTLTSLNVSDNRLGDEGIVHLCHALTSVNCTLTSLDVSHNELGDEGIKYLCKALADSNWKLRSLNLRGNRNITDVGKQCLFEVITGTDWEVREGLIFCRSIKSEA